MDVKVEISEPTHITSVSIGESEMEGLRISGEKWVAENVSIE